MALWWVRSDPCGLFSASFTILLILFAEYVVVSILLLPWYGFSLHIVIYTVLTILSMVSHTRAQFSDPGAVPKIAPPPAPTPAADGTVAPAPPLAPNNCRKCKSPKPAKAHHCSNCGRCIIRMDHHCPWVNNCVAIFNQKYFILFLFYTAVCCIYSGTLLVARFISCTHNLRGFIPDDVVTRAVATAFPGQCTVGGIHAALAIICFVEALIFGLFVIIMMFDQFSAIFDNTPGIDAMQHRKGVQRGKYESLRDVFGESFSWRWFFPLDLPQKMRIDFEAECARSREVEERGHYAHHDDHHGHHDHHDHSHELQHVNQHAHPHTNGHNPAEPLLSDSKIL